MNLIKFVIQRKTFISMLFVGLCLLGIISYENLPTELFPFAELPQLIVQINCVRDVDPDYVEKEAIIPIEGALGSLENIDRIESSADRRRGRIVIHYNESANIKYAYLKLTERVNALRNSLADEFIVNVIKIDTELIANVLMSLQARGTGGVDRVRNVVDEKVVEELENIEGIATVAVSGGRQKTVTITLNEAACDAQNITSGQIQAAINRYQQSKMFLGHVYEQNKHFFVNLVNEYSMIHELEDIVLKKNGPIRLKDVADVYVGNKESDTISRINGKDGVTINLVRDSQVNLIDVAQETRQVIERLNQNLKSDDLEIVIQSDAAEIMEENIDLIMELALIGGLLAIAVLWFFLHNIRLVLIVTLAIPISLFTAFNFFYAYDISINSLTLVGMVLAIGMLLDNSIVVLENIYRLLSRNKTLEEAVIQGTSEVWRSIFAATLTTITVFVPFIFASDYLVRLIGKHISVSIISTLLVSLAVALLLIPMAMHKILAKRLDKNYKFNIISQQNRFIQIYTLFLKSTMRFPARTILLTVIIFFLSAIICFGLSIISQQEVETDELKLYITMPQGATLEKTDLVAAEVEKKLSDIEEREDVVTNIYEEEATVTIKFKEDYEDINGRQLNDIKGSIQDKFKRFYVAEVSFDPPQSSSRFRQGGGGGRGSAGLQNMFGMGSESEKIVIKGDNFQTMRNLASDIESMVDEIESVNHTSLNIADNRPELHLLLDQQAFSYFDVSLGTFATELGSFENEYSSGSKFKIGTEEYEIIIKNEDLEDKTVADLREISVPDNSGNLVALDNLSQLLFTSGPFAIERVNQEKQIEVSYRFLSEINDSRELLEAARLEIDQVVEAIEIPAGIAVEVIHDETDYSDFYFLIITAFILIYMILASVFESLSTPFVMMFTIPLAAIGSFWAIILTGNSLISANTLIGFLILLGVVVNNGIILIDYTRILRQRGHSIQRALLTAGQSRLRPILITTITTIVALIPLAMGQAEYVSKIGAPFAITVIGGLSLSTIFTLIFIPTVYSGLEYAIRWWKNLSWPIKAIQLMALAAGSVFIYYQIESLLWRLANLTFLITIIPALTYFLLTSLRSASEKIIASNVPLRIKIQNLVKIYDSDSRFIREWKQDERQQQFSSNGKIGSLKPFLLTLFWKIPILGYLIYWVYFYLDSSGGWQFLLSHVVYLYVLWLFNSYLNQVENSDVQFEKSVWSSPFFIKAVQKLYTCFFWGFPLFNVVLFYFQWDILSTPIIIGIFWALALAIYATANRLHRKKINPDGLTGRFVGIRRSFYLLVKLIPVIGRKKQPFTALHGVSLEIDSGMFGLLGPNGAGKTTLMRSICGILEVNRGVITINGIKLDEKREELQSLIGYLPQEFGTYENMTAYEFLDYQAMLKGILNEQERQIVLKRVLTAVHLTEKKDNKIGSFSGGMRQRVGIAQTLLHLPRILVVDEPTAGLDPRERIRFRNLLVELSRDRIVIFSTHIIEDISSSCNAVAVLDKGELQYWGTPEDMAQRTRGVVWQVLLTEDEFEKVRGDIWVVHHIRDGEKIRVRFLAKQSPFSDAEVVLPTLEDAYLWMLGRGKHGSS